MSAIGDYIHYRALNYIKHGISTKGVHLNYQSQKAKIETQLKRQFTTAKKDFDLHQVETLANEIIEIVNNRQPKNYKIETVEEYYENFRMLFDEVISEWFQEPYAVNAGHLTWRAGQLKSLSLNKMEDIKNLNDTVEYTRNIVKLLSAEVADGMVEADWFLSLGKLFLKRLETLQKDLEVMHNTKDLRFKSILSYIADTQWENLSKYLGALQEMHNAAYDIPYAYVTNEMITERIQSLLPPKAREQAAEELLEASKLVFGKTKVVHSDTRQNNITASINRFKNTIFETISKKNELVFNLSWTENNLVDFSFKDSQDVLSKQSSLAQSIKYQTNIGLLDMLQETGHNNSYITHFLNIFASRLGAVPEVIKTHRLIMIEELKISSLYTLIRHNDLNALKKKKRADIIFQYDKATGKLSAHSIYSILENTYKNINSLEILMDGKSINKDFRRFPNRFWGDRNVPSYSDAWRRISNLLADAHQRKLQILMEV